MSLVASRKKSAEYVLPRQVIMYLCRKYTDSTLENIARLLGKKDHTTVIHGIDKISDLLDTDDSLRNDIDILTKKLNL
jgi:chromosomal replication initiator protein